LLLKTKPASFLNSVVVTIGSYSEIYNEEYKETNSNEKSDEVTSKLIRDLMKHSLSLATPSLCSYSEFSKKKPTWGGNINVNIENFNERDYCPFFYFHVQSTILYLFYGFKGN
jgi:hypothetical protein